MLAGVLGLFESPARTSSPSPQSELGADQGFDPRRTYAPRLMRWWYTYNYKPNIEGGWAATAVWRHGDGHRGGGSGGSGSGDGVWRGGPESPGGSGTRCFGWSISGICLECSRGRWSWALAGSM